jgi:hypothetical protein
MKTKTFARAILMSSLLAIVCSCSKDNSVSKKSDGASVLNNANGSTQISGVGFFDATDACNSAGQGASFAANMTGDLEGCWYVFVDHFECSPSGTYREEGREYFTGTYKGEYGTFWTTYKFEAKYEGCAENGSYLGAEIIGRCQHPLVKGSGTGIFQNVTGRVDMKDNIEEGTYHYRGHLNF